MFSKAKRFQLANSKTKSISHIDKPNKAESHVTKALPTGCKQQISISQPCSRSASATRSEDNPEITKCFITPKAPIKTVSVGSLSKKCVSKPNIPTSLKKHDNDEKKVEVAKVSKDERKKSAPNDLLATKDAEIRNKNQTISDYQKHVEQLQTEVEQLRLRIDDCKHETGTQENYENKQVHLTQNDNFESDNHDSGNEHSPNEKQSKISQSEESIQKYSEEIAYLENKIQLLEREASLLRHEVLEKQLELSSMEGLICIRDSLCKDLQEKLSEKETLYDDTCLRLELIKEHHALALQANESIRREYKLELDALKLKMEGDKQAIISTMQKEKENLCRTYLEDFEYLQSKMTKEKEICIKELEDQIKLKDEEMKAKLDQMEEKSTEQLRLCEIQFEERNRSLSEHWCSQQKQLLQCEMELLKLKTLLSEFEEKNGLINNELQNLVNQRDACMQDNTKLKEQISEMEILLKNGANNNENEIHALRAEIEKFKKDKSKFNMSLSATRETVNVLGKRLRDSDLEVEKLETNVKNLKNTKNHLEQEVEHYKSTLKNSIAECNEYKDALVNILKSKAALAKEHSRIMQHNVTLIESLQIVEKETYRELGNIKDDLVGDVERLKQESNSQIQQLRDEAERKRILLLEARAQLAQALTAATDSRALLDLAAQEITRLEVVNEKLETQMQDQAVFVTELDLLRKENEELSMTVAKQSSIIDQMKKEAETFASATPKSPSVHRKQSLRGGKENNATVLVLSPLRERNH